MTADKFINLPELAKKGCGGCTNPINLNGTYRIEYVDGKHQMFHENCRQPVRTENKPGHGYRPHRCYDN